MKYLNQRQRQIGLVVAVLVIGIILALVILGAGNKPSSKDAHDEQDNHADIEGTDDVHEESTPEGNQHQQAITLSQAQLTSQGIQLDAVTY